MFQEQVLQLHQKQRRQSEILVYLFFCRATCNAKDSRNWQSHANELIEIATINAKYLALYFIFIRYALFWQAKTLYVPRRVGLA